MYIPTRTTRALAWAAFTLCAWTAGAPAAPAAAQVQNDYGFLVVENADRPGEICKIPLSPARAVEKTRYYDNIPGCGFPYFRNMYFENAKSATILGLRSFYFPGTDRPTSNCRDEGLFSYRADIKTVGAIGRSETFDIEDVLNTDPADPVITPGVRLLSKQLGQVPTGSPVEHQFACLHITP